MKQVKIYCDGGCQGNPGPGAWAAILRYGDKEKVMSGQATQTTNNRMELTAIIEALHALKEPCQVIVESDSKYLIDGITGWVKRWVKNGWKTTQNKDVINRDLWETLLGLCTKHKVAWK